MRPVLWRAFGPGNNCFLITVRITIVPYISLFLLRVAAMHTVHQYQKLQFIHSVNGNGSKTAKINEKVVLPTITSPECQRDETR